MYDAILVINAGSSSIKFAVYREDDDGALQRVLHGFVSDIGKQSRFSVAMSTGQPQASKPGSLSSAPDHCAALQYIMSWLDKNATEINLVAVGHRVVHGGERYTSAVVIDAQSVAALQALVPLAPLHQPHALHAIETLQMRDPQLLQVACFDTAFHRDMPWYEQRFALPHELEQLGIRRYGFHGLSYEYLAGVLPDVLGARAEGKVVIAHLGHGVSMCAMQQRRSVATTMSFTPLDGLPMGRRSGAIDPAIILYLLQQGKSVQAISDILHHQSGLFGLSGLSDDMQVLLASSEPKAKAAVEFFCYRIARELGAMAATLQGLDALVFTGGIGEHAAPVREKICDASSWLGLEIDSLANQSGELNISGADSKVSVLVIPTDEEQIIARHTLAIIHGHRRKASRSVGTKCT